MLWRMVFGCSVMYLMMVQFLIHQNYQVHKNTTIIQLKKSMQYCKQFKSQTTNIIGSVNQV